MAVDPKAEVTVRTTRESDIPGIIALCERVYPGSPPWAADQLHSHLKVFPEGQLVATRGDQIVGMAASLIILWADYDHFGSWREFTDAGYFTNHDPVNGKTLYGAEVMVDPACQRCGIGKKIYAARREICQRFNLKRIRAGARLRHYHRYANEMDAVTYVQKIISGQIGDPTLSFQLKQGFEVLAVVQGYLRHDPESLGWAALIEWANPAVATAADVSGRDHRYDRPKL